MGNTDTEKDIARIDKPGYEEKSGQWLPGEGNDDPALHFLSSGNGVVPLESSKYLEAGATALRTATTANPEANEAIIYNYLEWDTPISDILPHPVLPSAHKHERPPHQLPQAYFKLRDPHTFSRTEKSIVVAICCYCTVVAAWSSAGYSMGIPAMMEEWGVGEGPLLAGLAIFTAGFSTAPMVLAPISEVGGSALMSMALAYWSIISRDHDGISVHLSSASFHIMQCFTDIWTKDLW